MMGERRVMQEALSLWLQSGAARPRQLTCFARSIGSWTFRRSGRHLEPYYSETGRPSIDPELMMRMLNSLGYSFGIRS